MPAFALRGLSVPCGLVVLAGALQACTEFASRSDTRDLPEESTVEPDSRPAEGQRRCVPGGTCVGIPNAMIPVSTQDAGESTLEPPLLAAPDAGAEARADGGAQDAGQLPSDCTGPGEFAASPRGPGCFVWVGERRTWDEAQDACAS